jgi:hypothetical protein
MTFLWLTSFVMHIGMFPVHSYTVQVELAHCFIQTITSARELPYMLTWWHYGVLGEYNHTRQVFTTINQHNLTLIDKKCHQLSGHVIGIALIGPLHHQSSPQAVTRDRDTMELDCHMSGGHSTANMLSGNWWRALPSYIFCYQPWLASPCDTWNGLHCKEWALILHWSGKLCSNSNIQLKSEVCIHLSQIHFNSVFHNSWHLILVKMICLRSVRITTLFYKCEMSE